MKEHTSQTLLFVSGLSIIFLVSIIGIFINFWSQPYTSKLRNTEKWIIHSDLSVNHLISMNLIIRNSLNSTLMALVTTMSELQQVGDDFDEISIGNELFHISSIWKSFLNKRNDYSYNRYHYNLNETLLLRGEHVPLSDSTPKFSTRDSIDMRKFMLADFVHKVLQNRTGQFDVDYQFHDDYLEKSWEIIKKATNNGGERINFLVLGPVTNLAKTLSFVRERAQEEVNNGKAEFSNILQDCIGKIVLYGGTTNDTTIDSVNGEYNLGVDRKARDLIFSYPDLLSKIYLFPVNYVEKTPLMDSSLVKFTRLFSDGCEKKLIANSRQPSLVYDVIRWWLRSYTARNSSAEFTRDYLQQEIIFNNEVVSASSLFLVDTINTYQMQFIDWSRTVNGFFKIVDSRYETRVNLIRKIDWYKYFGFLLHKCVYA